MLNKLLFTLAFLFAALPVQAANNAANTPTVATIAAMQALGAASAQYPTVNVASYSGTTGVGGGLFGWNAASAATADNCNIFTATGVGTGRWIRQGGGRSLDITQCGGVVGTDSTAAFDRATALINAAGAGGGFAPNLTIGQGFWVCTDEQDFIVSGVHIIGSGELVSILDFNPSVANKTLFHFSNGASDIEDIHVSNFGIFSTQTATKTFFFVSDGRGVEVDHIEAEAGNWPGADSIVLNTAGRDKLYLHDLLIYAARPMLFSVDPNIASEAIDHLHVQNIEAGSTIAGGGGGKVIEIADGVVISNVTFDGFESWTTGDYGLYWNDTTTASASYGLDIYNLRIEQGGSTSAYSIYLASSANNLQYFNCFGCFLDPARNGFFGRLVQRINFVGGLYGGVHTALNITGVQGTVVNLDNFLQAGSSTDTMTNLLRIPVMKPNADGTSPNGENSRWYFFNTINGSPTIAVTNLPACDAAAIGLTFNVTDANATTYFSIVAGGGGNAVPVRCDGTNWRIGG